MHVSTFIVEAQERRREVVFKGQLECFQRVVRV